MEIVQDKWKEILQRVRDEHELSEISFTTWIEPLTIHSVEDNLITILVPSEKMGLDYVSKKYTLPIKVAIAEITGVNYEIRFILPEEVKQEKAPAPVQKLREMSDSEYCPFVLWNGAKRLIKREKLDKYLAEMYSI